jgi:hypothetical protein
MRQLTVEEANVVGGAELNCGQISMSVGIGTVSFSGSLSAWKQCIDSAVDTGYGLWAAWVTGIPSGYNHVP